MKKFLAFLMTLMLLVSVLGVSALAEDPVEVTVWHLYGENDEPTSNHQYYLRWAEKFNEEHSDIHVTVTGGKGATDILTAISSGSTPDIFMNYWNNAPTWADAGALYDLTEFVTTDTEWDKDDIFASAWNLCYYNGKYYSIPNSYSTTFMFYNEDVLAECGWNEFPTTLEDMLQCIKDTTKADENGNIARLGMLPNMPWLDIVMWNAVYGSNLIADDGVTLTCNDKNGFPAALAFIKSIYQYYEDTYGWDYLTVEDFASTVSGNRGSASDPVLTGEVAMRWNSESLYANLSKYGADKNWNIAWIPNSTESGLTHVGMLTANVFEMNANTQHPQEAWTVLSSLTSKEAQKEFTRGEFSNGSFYARRSTMEYLNTTLADELGAAKEDATVGTKLTSMIKMISSAFLEGDLRSFPMVSYVNEYLGLIGEYAGYVFSENMDPQAAMDEVVNQLKDTAAENPFTPLNK